MLAMTYAAKTFLTPAIVFLAVLAALWILKRVVIARLAVLAERTTNQIDDLLVEVLKATRSFTLLATSLYFGSRWLPMKQASSPIVSKVFVLILMLQGALWVNAAITFFFRLSEEKAGEDAPASRVSMRALAFAARMVVWSIFLLLCLDNLGVNITGLVAGLGVGGIAVALAVQNILGDLFASLSIILDKPFEIGDFITVGEVVGNVEHIGVKTTRIRSISGEQIVVSNSDLLKSRIRNYKRMEERRIIFTLNVTYQTPHDRLARISDILRGIIEGQECTRFDRAHFKNLGDFSLGFEVVYYVLDSDYKRYMDIQQAINLEIHRTFEREGISFAYPTQTVFVAKEPGN